MDKEFDWYDHDMEELAKAMLKAKEAFDEYFDDRGMDGAYWDLEMKGFVLNGNFKRRESLDMKFRLPKEEEGDDDGDV